MNIWRTHLCTVCIGFPQGNIRSSKSHESTPDSGEASSPLWQQAGFLNWKESAVEAALLGSWTSRLRCTVAATVHFCFGCECKYRLGIWWIPLSSLSLLPHQLFSFMSITERTFRCRATCRVGNKVRSSVDDQRWLVVRWRGEFKREPSPAVMSEGLTLKRSRDYRFYRWDSEEIPRPQNTHT